MAGPCWLHAMRVIAKRALREFWRLHPDSEGPLQAWHTEAIKATWATPQQIKEQFRSANILRAGHVVFSIWGNKYRLMVAVDYNHQACYIRFIGTHQQYDALMRRLCNGYPTDKIRSKLQCRVT